MGPLSGVEVASRLRDGRLRGEDEVGLDAAGPFVSLREVSRDVVAGRWGNEITTTDEATTAGSTAEFTGTIDAGEREAGERPQRAGEGDAARAWLDDVAALQPRSLQSGDDANQGDPPADSDVHGKREHGKREHVDHEGQHSLRSSLRDPSQAASRRGVTTEDRKMDTAAAREGEAAGSPSPGERLRHQRETHPKEHAPRRVSDAAASHRREPIRSHAADDLPSEPTEGALDEEVSRSDRDEAVVVVGRSLGDDSLAVTRMGGQVDGLAVLGLALFGLFGFSILFPLALGAFPIAWQMGRQYHAECRFAGRIPSLAGVYGTRIAKAVTIGLLLLLLTGVVAFVALIVAGRWFADEAVDPPAGALGNPAVVAPANGVPLGGVGNGGGDGGEAAGKAVAPNAPANDLDAENRLPEAAPLRHGRGNPKRLPNDNRDAGSPTLN